MKCLDCITLIQSIYSAPISTDVWTTGGKKYPITKHQSVSSLSMLKFLWWSVANVFFSPAFVKTAYPFWSLVFLPYVVCGCPLCIVWFPALGWIQLLFHTKDSWFWVAYIGLIKPGKKKKPPTNSETFGSIWLDVGMLQLSGHLGKKVIAISQYGK